ncbi:MAG: phycobiliprotein lyase [Aphanocapsa sp. GSE-SYN-MK-11-07L]|jgi:hypothetical protein|nr:phycobiliprotein lyase [Aphanocapsa sp. GSE-SYN-MK-11-07L]
MNIVEFFEFSAGQWHSSRITHHLAFKASEMGDSDIQVDYLAADHPAITERCNFHQIDPNLAVGGSHVRWRGKMQWDRESDSDHEGETIFAIVPDADDLSQGRMLRDRGYAEIMPVVGLYHMDEQGGLVLTTEYESMSVIERIWFTSPNLRLRTSVVKLYGGFSTAALCTEMRLEDASESKLQINSGLEISALQSEAAPPASSFHSMLGW